MALLEKLTEDMKTAMKARDKERLTVVRALIADLKKAKIDTGTDLDEQGEIDFLTKQAKRRREAIDAFQDAGRQELADAEAAELAVIETYLPKQLSAEEATEVVRTIIDRVGASSKKDLGRVMGPAMGELKGRFPGKDVKAIVESLLED